MKTILVPTDFSRYAMYAFETAYQIALKTQGEICLLNVCQTNDYSDPLLGGSFNSNVINSYFEQVKESVGKTLDAIISDPKYAQVRIQPAIEFGSLTAQINQTAERLKADLIVMGTKGSSGVEELFLGSNTERTIRTAKIPVLTVPFGEKVFEPKSVVVPTTLFPNQIAVFEQVSALQKIYDCKVHLLYINNPQNYNEDEAFAQKAEDLAKEVGLEKYEFQAIASFNEENAIFDFVEQQKVDLIVMGTNQRKGVSHFFMGSLTEDIANHSEVPMWSISLRDIRN